MKKTKAENTEQPEKKEKIPWDKIKHDYITGNLTYMELSKKYKVSLESIKKQARKTDKRKGWVSLKREHLNKVYEKAAQKEAEKAAKEIVSNREKIFKEGENLLREVQKAVRQLSDVIVEHETVEKVTEFDYQEKKAKKETITTVKDIEIVEGMVDTKGLKNLADALLKIRDILTGSEPEEDDKFGIIELPAIEVPTPPNDEEEGGDVGGTDTDTAEGYMDSET